MSGRGGGIGSAVSPLVLRVLGAVVTAAWLASIAIDAFNPVYDPPPTIGLAFMAMVSAILGGMAVQGKEDKSKENPERRESNRLDREENEQ